MLNFFSFIFFKCLVSFTKIELLWLQFWINHESCVFTYIFQIIRKLNFAKNSIYAFCIQGRTIQWNHCFPRWPCIYMTMWALLKACIFISLAVSTESHSYKLTKMIGIHQFGGCYSKRSVWKKKHILVNFLTGSDAAVGCDRFRNTQKMLGTNDFNTVCTWW